MIGLRWASPLSVWLCPHPHLHRKCREPGEAQQTSPLGLRATVKPERAQRLGLLLLTVGPQGSAEGWMVRTWSSSGASLTNAAPPGQAIPRLCCVETVVRPPGFLVRGGFLKEVALK